MVTITSHHTRKETSQCGNLMVENVLMKVWIYKQRQAVSVWEVSDDSRSRWGKKLLSYWMMKRTGQEGQEGIKFRPGSMSIALSCSLLLAPK